MAVPLILTRDEPLRETLVRLAAAAGTGADVVGEVEQGLRAWLAAPLVLVGADLAPALAGMTPPRRPGVVVVDTAVDTELFRVALDLGAEQVVELPDGSRRLAELLADVADPVGTPATTLGVVGGCGGAGSSVLACAIGQVAARGVPALVIDTDPAGPGLDRVLGLESVDGVRWEDLQSSAGRLGGRALRVALPRRENLGVLTWRSGRPEAPPAPLTRAVLAAGRRGHGAVVVDLPRAAGPATEELVSRLDRLVVVTRATVLGVASAVRVCARYAHAERHLVVRGHGVPPEEIAAVTGVVAVTVMTAQRRLDESVDLGLGPVPSRRGPLHRAALELLAGGEGAR